MVVVSNASPEDEMTLCVGPPGGDTPTAILEATPFAGPTSPITPDEATTQRDRDESDSDDARRKTTEDISLEEWVKFLCTDYSALAGLYGNLHFNWMYFAPITLLLKFVLLAPGVLLEPESFPQLIGIACAEVFFALTMFVTNPYISTWTSFSAKLASSHQMIFVGLLCFHSIEVYNGNDVGLRDAFMSLSSIYFVLQLFLVGFVLMRPRLQTLQRRKAVRLALQAIGVPMAGAGPIYVDPRGSLDAAAVPAESDVNQGSAVGETHLSPISREEEAPPSFVAGSGRRSTRTRQLTSSLAATSSGDHPAVVALEQADTAVAVEALQDVDNNDHQHQTMDVTQAPSASMVVNDC